LKNFSRFRLDNTAIHGVSLNNGSIKLYYKRAFKRHVGVSGGDGGELNSGTLDNPVVLVFSLLDQISAMGETAKQLKSALTNAKPKQAQTLANIFKMTTTTDKSLIS
jgi:hypothetical protein